MDTPTPIDVTERLRAAGHLVGEHYNDLDVVYEVGDQLVKVKTWWELLPLPVVLPTGQPHAPAVEVYRVAGSLVGPDGKALRLAGDVPAVFGFGKHLTVQHDSDIDVAAEVEALRHECVADTLRAGRRLQEGQAIKGVGRREMRGA